MADRFYVPSPPPPGEFALTGPEAHHLAAVRRTSPGDSITLFCGDGHEYPAEVLAVGKKSVSLLVGAGVPVCRERGYELVVAAAMPKGDRGDFLIEKLTELGATRFVPLLTERTVVEPKGNRLDNLRRAVIEASKQCGRNVLLRIDDPLPWAKFLAADWPGDRVILDPGGDDGRLSGSRTVAVGPEGGFTPAEVTLAVGWRRVSLGKTILRVETAAIIAGGLR
jgi:16S rRNA (uracil1498-N3)-methyltransferase